MNEQVQNVLSDTELTARAFRAYFMASRKLGIDPAQPSSASGLKEIDGHQYVVLRNVDGILAVYRVRNDGKLKALKRRPASLKAGEYF